jgi:hypothetical protein
MGRRGRAHVYPRFGIDRLERDIRELYLELAREKGLVPHPDESSAPVSAAVVRELQQVETASPANSFETP